MIEMDWIWGLVGGLMIGSAAALFLLVNGRIMGASGILGGLWGVPGRIMEALGGSHVGVGRSFGSFWEVFGSLEGSLGFP